MSELSFYARAAGHEKIMLLSRARSSIVVLCDSITRRLAFGFAFGSKRRALCGKVAACPSKRYSANTVSKCVKPSLALALSKHFII